MQDAERIKGMAIAKARSLGAGDVRVCAAFPDEQSRTRMREAFERGDLSSWGYGAEYARRANDPSELLKEARSVICIAVPYATVAPSASEPLRGRISNYAWSRDYHERMRTLLGAVAQTVDEAVGEVATAIACDTRPFAERAFAARAGVGWIGKHTNVISPSLGSFVFLGEIVTRIELPSDAPVSKTCGACTRCVEVCPTRALRGDYTIDANRCISDLTQRKGSIPLAMRPLVGDWVWGCDLCQLTCPPTQRAGWQGDSADEPSDESSARPHLVELLQLRAVDFERRYRQTAMGWRGAAVLRRNAAVALGNSLDRSAVGALIETLRGDPHPMVRGHVAWALGRIGSPQALAALRAHMIAEDDETVRLEVASALEPFPQPSRSDREQER